MTLESFNLYPLLVQYTFGGLLMAGIGIAGLMVLIGMFTRQSPTLIRFLVFAFLLAYGIGYVGALVALPAFVFSMIYFGLAFYNWALGGGQ